MSTPGETKPTLSPEEISRRAAIAKRASASFGDIVTLMMRAPGFKRMPLEELDRIVVPAIASGQFSIAQAQSRSTGVVGAVGAVLWANVSAEIDERLMAAPDQPVRLTPQEWNTGPVVWVVEAVGDRRVIGAQLKQLREGDWKGREVRLRVRGPDGKASVRTLAPAAAA